MNVNKNWVVVLDPSGKYWPGAVVDAARADQLRPSGVVMLPIIPSLLRLSGVGGYAKREWGSGWPMDKAIPSIHAPLTMFCTRDFTHYHWVARLTAGPEHGAGAKFDGSLRMSSDPSQPNPLKVGLTPDPKTPSIDMRTLGTPDSNNGWTIGGHSYAQVPTDGHYGFGLYGQAPGLRIVWAAISLAEHG